MKIEYSEDFKIASFDGLKFRKDPRTGYFLSSKKIPYFGKRVRLHVYVWTKYNGDVPEGYHVHHKDMDKNNNDITNLMLMSAKEHEHWHGTHLTEEQLQERRRNIVENAVPCAIAWHSSSEGRDWHKNHYESMKGKLYVRHIQKCKCCGKEFMAEGHQKFCSSNCKSAWRRKQHLDDETRICPVCGKEFTINRYSRTKTCGPACGLALRKAHREKGACVQHGC